VHLDLVDVLRCPAPHADGWLVCATTDTRGRILHEGWLGCPICQAQYPVRDGVVDMGEPIGSPSQAPPRDDDVVRLAAALDLVSPGRLVVLMGAWAAYAAALSTIVPVRLVCIDTMESVPEVDDIVIAQMRGASARSVARGQVDGIALDAAHATAMQRDAAVHALRAQGRLVLPATIAMPDGVTRLTGDDELHVGVRGAVESVPVSLARRRAP
jgi:uncharacterized protein YbaR (Trm112 family)